ncbi:DUF1553 domain-containing protein [Pirellulaceae bacterium SH449]
MNTQHLSCCLLVVLLTVGLHGNALQGQSIVCFPDEIQLSHAGSQHQVVVQHRDSDGRLTNSVSADLLTWTVSNPDIAEVISRDSGLFVVAKRDGKVSVTFALKPGADNAEEGDNSDGGASTASLAVECDLMDTAAEIEFDNHVQSVLSRNGCNMGACHGALAGKGGFRLSLRGYDPETDHFNITRQDRGRRVDLNDPSKSLLLTKPTGAVPHKGGVRLEPDSSDYQLLAAWIGSGAYGPKPSDPVIERIEVLPADVSLSKHDRQNLIVQAIYSNGRKADVTSWAKFTSTDESVASVDEHGQVEIVGPGEGAISVWFASKIALARVRVPFASQLAKSAQQLDPLQSSGNSHLDRLVTEHLATLGLTPSPICSDSEFIRRSSLDATGCLPSEEAVRAFLADTSPDKRSRWIDKLLSGPEYVDYWTYRWSDLLTLNSNLLRVDGMKAYYMWIRNRVEANTPWDQFVREIITARGEALENGATNFYAINQDPESMTENVCQAFLGLSIGCAKCHNHPLEKWTNDQYYAMANMFARVRAKGWGGEVRNGDSARTLMVADRGDLIQPLRGVPQPPAPLDGEPLDPNDPNDRRIALADWLVSSENPYFTRAIVNRVWAAYFGIGIVNPVDDLRLSNPPSNEALMDYLCEELIRMNYDLKQFMQLIMNSDTYQRSSESNAGNADDKKYFSRYYPKRLMAEVIHDAIVDVTGVPSVFDRVAYLGGDRTPTNFYAKGTKAIQLFDSSVESGFLKTFGRNQRRITCECERSDEPSIIQVLNLNNGETLNEKLSSPGSIVDQLMEKHGDDRVAIVESTFLRCLARFPTDSEKQTFLAEFSTIDSSDRRIFLEDFVWSLVTSREFLFNH